MNKSDQLEELAAALAKAQGELENATKSSQNPHFKSKYADLAEVLNTVRPVFSRHGLSVTQLPSLDDDMVSVETMLLHSSGQWISSKITTPVGGKRDAQSIGSAITYARRYSLAAIAGIAQEDDDGNAAAAPQKPQPPEARPDQARMIAAIEGAETMDALKDIYQRAARAAKGHPDILSALERAKESRKTTLSEQEQPA